MTVEPDDHEMIALVGAVTIYEVVEVRERLARALTGGHETRVDLGDSGPWDLAGLQLLISLVRSGRERESRVRLVNVPPACHEVALRSGLDDWLARVRE